MPGKLDIGRDPHHGFYPKLAKLEAEGANAVAAYNDARFARHDSGPHSSANGPDYVVASNGLGAYVLVEGDTWFLSTFMGLPYYSQAYKDEVYAKAVEQLPGV